MSFPIFFLPLILSPLFVSPAFFFVPKISFPFAVFLSCFFETIVKLALVLRVAPPV